MPDDEREMEEAIALLRDAEMARNRNRLSRAKEDAMKALFEQLGALDKKFGLQVVADESWNELEVQLGSTACAVTYLREHGLRITRPHIGDQVNVKLDFDQAANRMVGLENDVFRTPIAGEAPKRRPAIAVLVEAIIDAVKPPKK